jgi:hypothetical protein
MNTIIQTDDCINIIIKGDKCFFCGLKIDNKEDKKEDHHSIPICLNPKFNVTIPVHSECHKKINSLFVLQQKTSVNRKLKNIVNEAMRGLEKVKEKIGEDIIK